MPDRTLNCALCSRSFGCDARSGGCWCTAVSVPAEALAELRGRCGDCVCPDCLGVAAASTALPSAPAHTVPFV